MRLLWRPAWCSRASPRAVGDRGGSRAGQAAKIPDLFAGMHQYDTLGLVWFDIAQNDGIYHQDWHIRTTRRPKRPSAGPPPPWPLRIHNRSEGWAGVLSWAWMRP